MKDEAFQQSVDEGRMLEGKLKEEIFRKELENRKKLEETRVEKVKNEAFKEGFEKGFTEEKVKYDEWAKKREDWYAEQGQKTVEAINDLKQGYEERIKKEEEKQRETFLMFMEYSNKLFSLQKKLKFVEKSKQLGKIRVESGIEMFLISSPMEEDKINEAEMVLRIKDHNENIIQ